MENEVKLWLSTALTGENLSDFSVQLTGNSEKGSGYTGDVLFVHVTGRDKIGTTKNYNLVLKCGKSDSALEDKASELRPLYERELFMYETVFPTFRQFELDRKIENPLNCLPKCYGIYKTEDKQVVVLENLKKTGFDLWDLRKALPKDHIETVVEEYAKFHAASVAMKEQEPEKFEELLNGISFDIWRECFDEGYGEVFKTYIKETYDALQGHLDENILETWLNFHSQVNRSWINLDPKENALNVITHGDCWNNNFMFKYNEEGKLSRVSIIDWQLATYTTPIMDLSYFLFSCISPEDISYMDNFLRLYYDCFISHLSRLGTNFTTLYPFTTFRQEWKTYSKLGVMICLMPIKVAYAEDEDLPDLAKSAEKGQELSEAFFFKVKNVEKFRNRMKPIVKYVVETGLI